MGKNDEELKQYVQRQIEHQFRLPLKVILPAVGTLLVATAGTVWWIHSIISPLDVRLAKLEGASFQPPVLTGGVYPQPVIEQRFLADTDDDAEVSTADEKAIRDLAYVLRQRPDLVAIVAGYTSKDLPLDEAVQISDRRARVVGTLLNQNGVSRDRIFIRGYGHKTPPNFPRCRHASAAIFLCDIFQVMSRATV